ncbi:MAG: hypothetical protein KDD75_15800 [Caldilineaceae bacterium]|nr:hypothetical protein [Caldilineaceae bacterium]
MVPDQSADLLRLSFLDTLPLWILYILTVALLLLAVEGGYRLSKWMQRRSPDRAESAVGAVNGASLALLAFLLAFVVSIALNQFSGRRGALVAESNAIGTAYLRAGALPDSFAANARELLREYTDQRIAALDPAKIPQVIARSEEIHDALWTDIEMLTKQRDTPTVALYMAAVNDVIDLHTDRINIELVARVPTPIVLGLFFIALMALGLVGLHGGYGEGRNLVAIVALVLILSVVFLLILDLGRSQEGLLRISYQSMFDLQRSLNAGR